MTRRVNEITRSKRREEYDSDDILRMGFTHLVQVIGEAARRVSSDFQKQHPEIPWRQINGMRHRIVHDYMRVDEDVLWHVVSTNLPALLPMLEKLLPEDG
ncbi:MAG: DUF86 domain-containing protein [Bacteroidota bacterium]